MSASPLFSANADPEFVAAAGVETGTTGAPLEERPDAELASKLFE